jgi:nitrite reductase/ring-hydroxylating ferredoxin subunit
VAGAVWTAIGLSRDLEAGAATGVIVSGQEWALWRGVSGRAHLWEDRCPHRGMRLSLGFVREDRFGCLYHGWQYDETGQCRLIPAHPDLTPPASIRIRGRAVAESGGLIWACFADDPPAPPDFAGALPVRSLYLDAPLAAAKAALGAASPAPGAGDAVLVGNWLVAGQIVDDGRCALHIAAFGGEDSVRRAALWAAGLRYEVEGVEAAS